MATFIDLTEKIFGRLRALHVDPAGPRWPARWICRCECGTIKSIDGKSIRQGRIRSCGCLLAESTRNRMLKHGKAGTREYQVWQSMKWRCLNPNDRAFKNYGGRGVSVCNAWLNSFEQFKSDMGPKPTPSHSLERIDNDGNYEPSNCKWATRSEQNLNRRKLPRARSDREERDLMAAKLDHARDLRKNWEPV